MAHFLHFGYGPKVVYSKIDHPVTGLVVTSVLRCFMGWEPIKSSQNTSYDQISGKNHYIYQIRAIKSKFTMTENTMYTKNHRSQSLIYSFSTKQNSFFLGWGPVKSSQNTSYDQISLNN